MPGQYRQDLYTLIGGQVSRRVLLEAVMTNSVCSATLLPLKLFSDESRCRFEYREDDSGAEAIAIVRRYLDRSIVVHARIHSSCMKSKVFHSLRWRLAGTT